MDLTGRNISDYLVKTYPSLIRTRFAILAMMLKLAVNIRKNKPCAHKFLPEGIS